MIAPLLAQVGISPEPLSAQLMTAAAQLSSMHKAGLLARLSDDARTEMAALALFLVEASDMAWEMEDAARDRLPRREGRMRPIGDLIARIAARVQRP